MADRALLHKDKLESLKSWLDRKKREHRPGAGNYQLLQIKHGAGWQVIYSRDRMDEHVTVPEPLIPLVKAFIREGRKAAIEGTLEKLDTLRSAVDDEAPWG